MGIFGFGKKKEVEEMVMCDCGNMCSAVDVATKKAEEEKACCNGGKCASTGGAAVKVLGSGCTKCNQLEEATVQALAELGMDTTVDHVADFAEIAAYGVMTTPALVVNGKVISYGKVLKKDEVVKLLKNLG